MLQRGGPIAEPEAHQKENTVERVNSGVDAFGQHGGTARDAGDHELCDGDRHVRRDRAIDCTLEFAMQATYHLSPG